MTTSNNDRISSARLLTFATELWAKIKDKFLTKADAATTYATKDSLATVATTGSYDDLQDQPTIIGEAPEDGKQYARKNGDWVESTGGADLSNYLNKASTKTNNVNGSTYVKWYGSEKTIGIAKDGTSDKIYLTILSDGNKYLYACDEDTYYPIIKAKKDNGNIFYGHAEKDMALTGGTFTGPIKFNSSSMSDGGDTPAFLCYIDNFAAGGELHYKPIGGVVVGRSRLIETWKKDASGTFGSDYTARVRWLTTTTDKAIIEIPSYKLGIGYLIDYNSSSNVIQLGYSGNSLSTTQYLAGYSHNSSTGVTSIKDIKCEDVSVGNATTADSADKVDGFHVSVTISGTAQTGGYLKFIG